MTEKEILVLNDPHASYCYCLKNKDANVKLHEDIIVNNKDACYEFRFAKDISGANIERLQEVVINSNDPYYIYCFALCMENSNKEELFKSILKIGNEKWIFRFIKDIPLSEEVKELVIFI